MMILMIAVVVFTLWWRVNVAGVEMDSKKWFVDAARLSRVLLAMILLVFRVPGSTLIFFRRPSSLA